MFKKLSAGISSAGSEQETRNKVRKNEVKYFYIITPKDVQTYYV